METNKPVISVIIPVYNAEKFLQNCIQSIFAQTFTDFEVILVDDGSTDGSGDLCDRYATSDKRIKSIHQSNFGPGIARNKGLEKAMGDYILFIDSDDIVHPKYFEILIEGMKTGDFDIVQSGVKQFKAYSQISNLIKENYEYLNINCMEFNREEWFEQSFIRWDYIVVWGKLFKRTLIGDKSFINTYYAEDVEFTTSLNFKLTRCLLIDKNLYFQRVNDKSLTAINLPRKYHDHLYGLWNLTKNIPKQDDFFINKILMILYGDMASIKNWTQGNEREMILILTKQIINETKYSFYFNKKIPFLNKMFFTAFYYMPITFKLYHFYRSLK